MSNFQEIFVNYLFFIIFLQFIKIYNLIFNYTKFLLSSTINKNIIKNLNLMNIIKK